jgi:protein-L-isoaspartate(D-aspartate) O-methyltransferase
MVFSMSCDGGGQSAKTPGTQPAGTAASTGSAADGDPRGDHAAARESLVASLTRHSPPITSKRVLDAMRAVPRHEFVPEAWRDRSYDDSALPLAEGQTISQPYIVALMTQLLELEGHERVLEIGTGSGYQAAILGELAAEVYTVEIRPTLLESARQKLEALKARGVLHYRSLKAIVGDGRLGFKDAAPYDAIIVTAAPPKVPVELLNQLKPGGRMVIPVGDFFQELQLIRKRQDGTYLEEPGVPVRFVPLVEGTASGSPPQ